MRYRIVSVEPRDGSVVRVTYNDGFAGDYDLAASAGEGSMFAPLQDRRLFETVAVAQGGHSFGWRLDRVGEEIDFCADATRIQLETQAVMALAKRYRAHSTAAE